MEEITIGASSPISGKSLVDAKLRERFGVMVVAIQRDRQGMQFNPDFDATIGAGDKLVVLGRPDSLKKLEKEASER
jgi:voltage-gated potassium channel